jgi:hypothetical protein
MYGEGTNKRQRGREMKEDGCKRIQWSKSRSRMIEWSAVWGLSGSARSACVGGSGKRIHQTNCENYESTSMRVL